MITKDFFITQMDRLKKNFGEFHYQGECVAFIWQEVKSLESDILKDIIDNFIADSRFAPKRNDFREAMSQKNVRLHYQHKAELKQQFGKMLSGQEVSEGLQKYGLDLARFYSEGSSEEKMRPRFKLDLN